MARLILMTDLAEEYAKQLLAGIARYSREKGPWNICRMPLTYRDLHGVKGVVEWALKWNADAIIGQFYNTDDVKLFKQNGIVAIAQDFKSRFIEIPNITGNHQQAGKMGAEYFIRKGFRKFAFFGISNVVWSEERELGFQKKLIDSGLGSGYYTYMHDNYLDLWFYDAKPILEWLKQLPKPIGIMACDDNQGHHLVEICKQNGILIPEEVALLGVDDDEAICSLSNPPLSSISQAVEHGGYEAAILIEQMIKDPSFAWKDVVVEPTHIITRESTDTYATKNKNVLTVLRHIHQNLSDDLSVSDLTGLVPLSRRAFEIQFKKETGYPIYNYILNLRIEKLAEKLIESDMSIIEIASSVGLCDYKNVSRQFKHLKGSSPSEYRMLYRNISQKEDVNA